MTARQREDRRRELSDSNSARGRADT